MSAKKWNKELIIAELRKCVDASGRVRAKGIHPAALLRAIYKHFGSLHEATEAAGLSHHCKRNWEGDAVIEELQEYVTKGGRVTAADLRRAAPALLSAIYKRFSGVPEAAAAAGVAHECIRKWDKPTVAEALRERAARGLAMDSTTIKEQDPGLHTASLRQYGSLRAAAEAARVDLRKKPTKWSETRIVDTLLAHAARGEPYNASAMQRCGGFYDAAVAKFGSFDAAVEAAGLPSQRRQREDWTRDDLIKFLRDRASAGLSNTPKNLEDTNATAYNAIRRIFGSIDAAMNAAGLEVERSQMVWSSSIVVSTLQEYANRGVEMSASGIRAEDEKTFHACLRYFSSTDEAVRAAGLVLVRRQRQWTQEDVIQGIRSMSTGGVGVTATATKSQDATLYYSAMRIFGSWGVVMQAAGLAYEPLRRDAWTKEEVIEAIGEYAAAGIELSAASIRRADDTLYNVCLKLFDSFGAAVNAAGCEPVILKRSAWTTDDILKVISDRVANGLDVNYSAVNIDIGSGVMAAAVDLFGSWDDALRAADVDPVAVSREREGPKWGRVFETLMRELLWEIHGKTWEFMVRAGNLKPDLYDPVRDACIDLKAGAWIYGVDDTVAAYAAYGSAVDIIYGRGKGRKDEILELQDGPREVRFIPWAAFAELAHTPAAVSAVAALERLTAEATVPADLRDKVSWKAPPECRNFLLRRRPER